MNIQNRQGKPRAEFFPSIMQSFANSRHCGHTNRGPPEQEEVRNRCMR